MNSGDLLEILEGLLWKFSYCLLWNWSSEYSAEHTKLANHNDFPLSNHKDILQTECDCDSQFAGLDRNRWQWKFAPLNRNALC